MASLDTYAELKSAVADYLRRTDLADVIPTFIELAEARFNRLLIVPNREAATTLTAAATVSLPADFSMLRSAYLDTDPKVVLEQMTLASMRRKFASASVGEPRAFAIQSGNALVLGPSPDNAYDININYYQKIPALSDANSTNWLLTGHPDAYLYGALAQAEAYVDNKAKLTVWKRLGEEAMTEIMVAGSRAAHGGAPQRLRAPVAV